MVAVSEERGTISVAYGGELRTLGQSGTLREDIVSILKERLHSVPPRP